jgi:hypothetical protein
MGISSERVRSQSAVNIDHLECSICLGLLWKPIACQTCQNLFCSACINQWLVKNPSKCPNRCETYTERKCPPLVAKLLAQLQITCIYQLTGCNEILAYEALDKHQIECDYQLKKCPGCESEMLQKDLSNHMETCEFFEWICNDCKVMYKRSEATTKHTKIICLRERLRQLRQLRDESKESKNMIQQLTYQLNEICTWKGTYNIIAEL